jgi:hypothetical protein
VAILSQGGRFVKRGFGKYHGNGMSKEIENSRQNGQFYPGKIHPADI